MNPYQHYMAVKAAAAAPLTQLPDAIERPFEHFQRDTAGPTLQGMGIGAGVGALAGAGFGMLMREGGRAAAASVIGGGLAGSLIGGALGQGIKVQENVRDHARIVRDFERQSGEVLPYDVAHPYEMALNKERKGMVMGMAADTLASGSPFGVSSRPGGLGVNTYGMGASMGTSVARGDAREQFGHALAEYKRDRLRGQ